MSEIANLFLLSLLGSLIALAGGVIFLFNKTLSSALEKHAIPFAAGVLVTVAILGLLPEAVHAIGDQAYLYVLISFFTVFLFERVFFEIHHHQEHKHNHDKHIKSSVPMVIIGDSLHNFIDGVAIAATFLVNPGLGLITAISTFLHEIPHEIGDFGILLKAKWKKKDILVVNIISASMTIVGAFLLYFIGVDQKFVGIMMAISSGIFLYLGAIDFLPHVVDEKEVKLGKVIPLILGVLVMVATLYAVPHSHEDGDEHEGESEHLEEIELHENELMEI